MSLTQVFSILALMIKQMSFWYKMPFWYRWYCKGCITHSDQGILLTFDDGPHPEITPWVLKQLAPYEVKAIFFCIGNQIQKHPEILAQIKEAGHTIGNHSFHHENAWKTKTSDYLQSIENCEELTASKYFRPPYGKIKRHHIKILKSKNYKIMLWSLLSRDYDSSTPPHQALKQLKSQSKDNSIVVFHDSPKAFPQLKAIFPEYLDFLAQQKLIRKKSI